MNEPLPPLDPSAIMGANPSPMGGEGAPPAPMPPPEMPMTGMGGEMMMPPPEAGAELPYDVVIQPDGSSIYQTKTEPPIVIGLNKAPKMPDWLSGGSGQK